MQKYCTYSILIPCVASTARCFRRCSSAKYEYGDTKQSKLVVYF